MSLMGLVVEYKESSTCLKVPEEFRSGRRGLKRGWPPGF